MTKVALKTGQKLSPVDRIQKILEVRELLETGYISTNALSVHFNCSRDTAMAWRNAALQLIAKDTNGFTRDGIRNLQIGRIMAKIERMEALVIKAPDQETELKVHGMLNQYYERLHRITGLNTEVSMNYTSPKQLVIIKSEATTPKSHNVVHDIDNSTTKP